MSAQVLASGLPTAMYRLALECISPGIYPPCASGPTPECRSAHKKGQACTALLAIASFRFHLGLGAVDRFGSMSLYVSSSDRALMLPLQAKYSGLHDDPDCGELGPTRHEQRHEICAARN